MTKTTEIQYKRGTVSSVIKAWADSAAARKRLRNMERSSIFTRGDAIYHYGYHYPMAVIERYANGKTKSVIVNSTPWGRQGGFGPSTDERVRELVEYLNDSVGPELIQRLPLTPAIVYVEASPDDPEPVVPVLDIPKCPRSYTPTDPGPMPTKDPEGCIAGQIEEYEFQRDGQTWTINAQPPRGAFIRGRNNYGGVSFTTEHVGTIEYGENAWKHPISSNVTYKQCPHCKAHDKRVTAWHRAMGGVRQRMGWRTYAAMIERFGDESVWRQAYRVKAHEQREASRALRKWQERHYVPYRAIPTRDIAGVSVPKINPETGRMSRATFRQAKRRMRYSYH